MAKALNRKPRSLTLLIIVLPGTHVGWYHLPQVLIEGFIIDCKPIDRSGDISWNEDVVERHWWLLVVYNIALVLAWGATLIKA